MNIGNGWKWKIPASEGIFAISTIPFSPQADASIGQARSSAIRQREII